MMPDTIVDIITDKGLFGQVEANVPKSSLVPAYPMNVKGMVDAIISFVGNNKIKVLRIWSHGWTHYADERDYPNGNFTVGTNNIRVETFEQFRKELDRLTSYFAKPARVELRGCSPAKGNGKDLMVKLAQLWGVDIHGSTEKQELIFWKLPVYVATPGATFNPLPRPIEVY